MRVRLPVRWGIFALAVAAIVLLAVVVKQTPAPAASLQGVVPPPCADGASPTPSKLLVLTDSISVPKATVHVGDVIELSFPDVRGLRLRVPTQKPALTCSLGTAPDGPTSTLLVRALRPGTVLFFTTLAGYTGHVAMPAVFGHLEIT